MRRVVTTTALVAGVLLIRAPSCDAASAAKSAASDRLTIDGRLQASWQYTNDKTKEDYNNTFSISRCDVTVKSRISEAIGVVAALNAKNSANMIDQAYVIYTPAPNIMLRVGQMKPPFSRAFLRSGARLLVVDRGAVYSMFKSLKYIGYHQGAELGLNMGVVDFKVAVINGNGQYPATDDNSAKDIVARVNARWSIPAFSMFELGGDVHYKTVNVPSSGNDVDDLETRRYAAFGVDMNFESKQFLVEGEVLAGKDYRPVQDDPEAKETAMLGGEITGMYTHTLAQPTLGFTKMSPAFKLEYVDPDTDSGDNSTMYLIPSLTLWMEGWTRLQFDVVFQRPEKQNDENKNVTTFKAQWTGWW